MRIPFDECVPSTLRRSLKGHQIFTVQEKGWGGKRNGMLLTLMSVDQVDLMITVDRRIKFQQNLDACRVSLIVLLASSNRLADLLPLVPQVQAALATISPGDYVELSFPS